MCRWRGERQALAGNRRCREPHERRLVYQPGRGEGSEREPMPGGSTSALPKGTLAGDLGRQKAEDPACASTSKSRQDREANDLSGVRGGGRRHAVKIARVTTTSGVFNPTRAPAQAGNSLAA
jgi:hypothetical protein